MQSDHFISLSENLDEIEATFLSMEIKTDGSYNLQELSMARAYGLLVHAEIESYFENVAKEVVLKSYTKWKSDKKPSHVLMSITAFLEIGKKIPKEVSNEKINQNEEGLIDKRLEEHVSRYVSMLSKNNGIKETDLLKILLPLGIHLNDIDHTFLISVDSFGRDRGEIAHNSIKTISLNDPFAKKNEVVNILNEIRILDYKIISLK